MPDPNQTDPNQNANAQPFLGVSSSDQPVIHHDSSATPPVLTPNTTPNVSPVPNLENSQTQESSANVAGAPAFLPQTDLPPLPPDFLNVSNESSDKKTDDTSNSNSGSAAPLPDLPLTTNAPKKKFGGGRIIATILGLFLLVGGIAGGVILTEQNQNIAEKASFVNNCGVCKSDEKCDTVTGACVKKTTTTTTGGGTNTGGSNDNDSGGNTTSPNSCVTDNGCGSGQICTNGTCVTGSRNLSNDPNNCGVAGNRCSAGATCVSGQCSVFQYQSDPNNCGVVGNRCATGTTCQNGSCLGLANDPNNCGQTGNRCATGATCVSGQCVSGGTINCGGVQCNPNNCHCTGGDACTGHECVSDTYITNVCTSQGRSWCDNVGGTGKTCCAPGYRCATNGNGCVPNTGGTNPPGGGSNPTASCQNIKAYSSTWTLLTDAQLAALTPSTVVNFCVVGSASSGVFDRAKFTINTVAQSETTTKRPSSNDFCQNYAIPSGVKTFNITAQIHHESLGWK